MARKNVHYYLIKTARISGWLLLPLMVLYIVTGFAICGEYGISGWVAARTGLGTHEVSQIAVEIHKIFEWPLVGAFLVHCSTTIYFALRRWGWIKTKTCK